MARKSIAELKAHFKSKQTTKNNKFENKWYPFWEMDFGKECSMRLLSDPNEENPDTFFIEQLHHNLHVNGESKWIPCITMWGEKCPICERSSKYYKVEGKESEKGKYYWRQKNNLGRIIVTKDPLPPNQETGESCQDTIQTTSFSNGIINSIVAGIADFKDTETVPWDVSDGCDFIIKKTKKNTPKGVQGDYSTSVFAREHSIATTSQEVLDAIAALPELKTLLPKNPGIENVIALLEAHDTGRDAPASDDGQSSSSSSEEEKPNLPEEAKNEPKKENSELKVESVKSSEPEQSPDEEDDILARIKNRNKNKG